MSFNFSSVRKLKNLCRRSCDDYNAILKVLEEMEFVKGNFRVYFGDTEDDAADVKTLEYIVCKVRKLGIPMKVFSLETSLNHRGTRNCVNFQVRTGKNGVMETKLLIEILVPTFLSMASDRYAIPNAIFRGKSEHLKFLLNSGREKEFYWDSLWIVHCEYIRYELYPFMLNLLETFAAKKEARRILLIVDIIYACESVKEDTAENMRLIWRSVPDAYVTFEEIYGLFYGMMGTTSHQLMSRQHQYRLKSVLQELCKKTPYPLPTSKSPRALAHYCRCAIRGRLRDNNEIPLGFYSLGLPRKLVSYLKLDFGECK
ncbi:hypothetical protein JTE90_024852 [Oedothorax gibbosus]|uniref:SOCS box domain-containing protein n=1 Tax=Oedothorax gibbosus TaxID=931172 RepID=A0AAV6V384_9ARAC|nr:hypothetical protein JTE90_024852 [Oedothorax gibbosus]